METTDDLCQALRRFGTPESSIQMVRERFPTLPTVDQLDPVLGEDMTPGTITKIRTFLTEGVPEEEPSHQGIDGPLGEAWGKISSLLNDLAKRLQDAEQSVKYWKAHARSTEASLKQLTEAMVARREEESEPSGAGGTDSPPRRKKSKPRKLSETQKAGA